MTQAQLVTDLTGDVVMIAFAASAAFIVTYSVLAPWWRTELGRSLIVLDTGLALTLGPLVLHRLFGLSIAGSIWFSYYYLISLALVAGGTLWRTWITAKVQWRARRKPEESAGDIPGAPLRSLAGGN